MVYNAALEKKIFRPFAKANSVMQQPGFTRWFSLAVLVGILILGFCLRALNITWGIPEMHPYLGRHMEGLYPDEVIMISQIRGVLEGGLFELGTLLYPPVQALLAVPVAWLTNWSGTPHLYLIARSISIAASLASILALYFLAKKWNHRMALIAPAFLCVSMAAARESHWANPESLSAFWILLATVVLFHLLEHDRLHLYFFLGACIGLSFSSKYLGVLFLHLPIVGLFLTDDSSTNFSVRKRLGSLLANSRSAARNLFVSYAGFSVVVFFCLAIFILRNFELFVEAYDTHSPWTANHGLFGTFPPPASVPSYLVNVFLTALGVPLYFCSLSGMVLAGFTRDRKILILLITVLPFWLFLEIIHYHQLRFSVTLLPFLCLLAAYFIDFLMKANLKYARALAGSALVLTLLYSATYTYAFIHVLAVERDPRFVITRWMEENAVDEETVAVLGHDITTNSLGFIRYDGMDRLSGRAYSKPGYPRFIFLPSGSSEILDQYLELTANGYTYSQEDWWPIAPPSEETIRLFENLSEKDNYEIVRVFRNKPQFNGIQFDTERLKFDTFRITDLEILVYERKLPGSRTDS